MSLNLIVGYAGLLSVTHAAFYGVGAYTTAILISRYETNFFLTAIAGAIIAGLLALLFGLILKRFKADYYALVTFGLNIIVFSVFLNWQELTRGPLGIPGIDRPELFGFVFKENIFFLVLVGLVAYAIYELIEYVVKSSFGRTLKALREDEVTTEVLGYKTENYKMVTFSLSAALAAIAGSFFASYITFIDPSTFSLDESIFILSLVILGGLANSRGVFWGTVVLILLPEALRFVGFPTDIAAQMRQVVYGLLLVFLMMYRPRGFMGKYRL
jgi:branched-chain amino acid transport system permease protein